MKHQVICIKEIKNELILNKKYTVEKLVFHIDYTGKTYLIINEYGYLNRYSTYFLQELSQNRKNKIQKFARSLCQKISFEKQYKNY